MDNTLQRSTTVCACVLLMLLAASGAMALLGTALAYDLSVPGDSNGDHVVSDEELAAAKEAHQAGKISDGELDTIRLIHDDYPINVSDSTGEEITVYKPLERIVVFNNQVSEVMQILGAQDRIVGVAISLKKDPLINQALRDLPDVGEVTEPDLEAVMKLNPDAVFDYSSTIFTKNETFRKLRESNPNMVIFRADLFRPETYAEEVRKLARVLDEEDKAKEYIDFYNGVLSQIKDGIDDIPEEEKPSVYLEHSSDFGTAANGSGYHSDVVMAGGRNVFADLPTSYPTVDQEAVMAKNPDIIVKLFGHGSSTTSGGYINDNTTEMEALRDTIINRPGSKAISAVENNRVYVLYSPLIDGAKHIIGVSYLAKLFYPEALGDFDPVEVHRRYLKFLGSDFDLDKHDAFVVPEMTDSS